MAIIDQAHPQNSPGPIFVDTTCIDCGTCYHLADTVFKEEAGSSIVYHQPEEREEWSGVKRAIVSCPTNSIGLRQKAQAFIEADLDLPLKIHENVFYCGYTSKDSYGATSYLIQRPEGNILIDSPRFHAQLVKALEELGGVSMMILTHRDDVADHQKFHEHFDCKRVIHQDEVSSGTKDCEFIWEDSEDRELFPDLKLIFTPGHTKGHLSVLYKDLYLFTGDHLFVNEEEQLLEASKSLCWYSWKEQVKSIEKLLHYDFEWVLPGHGGWGDFGVSSLEKVSELLERIKIHKE
jgi:glyoxylase-like metal-dependent hydrolase (beta-lactamase superfamily II)/ferredoxin